MLSQFRQSGVFSYVEPMKRSSLSESVREELRVDFDELYASIEDVRAQARSLAKSLRFVFFGVDDPDEDEWQARVFP